MKHRFWLVSATLCLSFVLCDAHASKADNGAKPIPCRLPFSESPKQQYLKEMDARFATYDRQTKKYNQNKTESGLTEIFATVSNAYKKHEDFSKIYCADFTTAAPKQYVADLIIIHTDAAIYIDNFILDTHCDGAVDNTDQWLNKRDTIIRTVWRLVDTHKSYKDLISKEDAATLNKIYRNKCQVPKPGQTPSAAPSSNPHKTTLPASPVPTTEPTRTPTPRSTPKPTLTPVPKASTEPSPADTTDCGKSYEPEKLAKELDDLEKDLASEKLEYALRKLNVTSNAIKEFKSEINCQLQKDASKYQTVMERYLELVMKLTDRLLETGLKEKKSDLITQADDLWQKGPQNDFIKYIGIKNPDVHPPFVYLVKKIDVYKSEFNPPKRPKMELARIQKEIKAYNDLHRLGFFLPDDVLHFINYLESESK